MSPRTVWLASYPKSGNTWMRAVVTALSTHRHLFGVNQLGSGAQPHYVGGAFQQFGIDVRWLDFHELEAVRAAQVRLSIADPEERQDQETQDTPDTPTLRKTHEIYRPGKPGREPFPAEATRAAILIVRDPRDVACSYAPFFGLTLDQAIDAMGRDASGGAGSPSLAQTSQPWGSWSTHSLSWLGELPFPVHVVRYEDMKADTVGALLPIFEAIGMGCTREQLEAAVEQTRFERLQQSEAERGFRETSKNTRTFFRKGQAGGWREELTAEQVAAIEADHAEVMTRFGYELTTDPAERAALAEARESRRRQAQDHWLKPPAHLGLNVTRGPLPESLPDAENPRPWIWVAENKILVRFAGGAGLLVENGTDVTVEWPEPGESPGEGPGENPDDNLEDTSDDDPSWLVQGWGVTLASLQRGNLSLHAATVRIGDELVAIAGHRGAGKSTTSMGLRRRGHQLLVDDVALIEFRGDEAWTTPYARNVHLLPDAAEALGVSFDALPMLAGGRTKVAFRAEEPPIEPHRIDRIVVLNPRPDAEEVTLTSASGSDRLMALVGHTRRDGIAPLVLGHTQYFTQLAKLANSAPVQVLRRPREGWSLDQVLDLIEGSNP